LPFPISGHLDHGVDLAQCHATQHPRHSNQPSISQT
jgi:hypothetical protein